MSLKGKILIITPGFPADEQDQYTLAPVQVFLNNYQKLHPDQEFIIITLQFPFLEKEYFWNQIKVFSCGGKNRKHIFKLNTLRKAFRKAKQYIQSENVTLLHSLWLSDAAIIAGRLSRKYNIPHLITLMGQDVLSGNKYLKLLDFKKHKLVAVSQFQSKEFTNTTNISVDAVIPWGIDKSEFSLSGKQRTIDIFGVGSLISLKQYHIFIEVIEQLAKTHPQISAVLTGSGPEYAQLQKMIFQKKLEKNIKLTGQLPRRDTLLLMQKSKIFLHPSQFESLGYACLEAMGAGCYIVSFPTGIASPSEKWQIANNTQEMVEITEDLLKAEQYDPYFPYTIEETVAQYKNIYEATSHQKD